jgi:multiple sugar transport system substrate-binding protein
MNKLSLSRNLKVIFAAALAACAAGAPAAHAAQATGPAKVELAPIKYRSQYGNLKFPDKFPDGTSLEMTVQSHFVPAYDQWFDSYAHDWGKAHNVEVTVFHMNLADLNKALSAAIESRQGSAVYETVVPPSMLIEGLQPLNDVNEAARKAFGEQAETCSHSTYLPAKKEWFGFCQGWVINPGAYRISWWKDAGYPHGPKTYADLLDGGRKIFEKTGHAVGVGMSPELDSEWYARALIWAFGGSIQDSKGNVVLDSPAVVKAVAYQKELFKLTESSEVFNWTAASNNEGFMANRLSYIQNPVSFYRTALDSKPDLALDTAFVPALAGPSGRKHVSADIWLIDVLPQYVKDENTIAAAKKFMLDLAANYGNATYNSKMYNLPAFTSNAPRVWKKGGWLSNDSWGAKNPGNLEILRGASKSTWLGYPGYADPAASEVYFQHIIPAMMAAAASGKKTPEQAVKDAADQIKVIVEKWRAKGDL